MAGASQGNITRPKRVPNKVIAGLHGCNGCTQRIATKAVSQAGGTGAEAGDDFSLLIHDAKGRTVALRIREPATAKLLARLGLRVPKGTRETLRTAELGLEGQGGEQVSALPSAET